MRRASIALLALVALASIAGAAEQTPRAVSELIRPPADYIDARVLAADVAETVTVPTFATYPSRQVDAIFGSTCTAFLYRIGGTAAVPSADVTNGTGSGYSPSALRFDQADTFSIVSPDSAGCKVSIEFYISPGPR